MFSKFGTLMTEKPGTESALLRISVRAWIAVMLTATICYMGLRTIKVEEPLYTLATIAVGFYFGRQSSPQTKPARPADPQP